MAAGGNERAEIGNHAAVDPQSPWQPKHFQFHVITCKKRTRENEMGGGEMEQITNSATGITVKVTSNCQEERE